MWIHLGNFKQPSFQLKCDGTRWRTGRELKGKMSNGVPFTLPHNMVYPALLPLMCTSRLPVVDWIGAPADLNGLVPFAEKRNLVSARVPSHFKWPLPIVVRYKYSVPQVDGLQICPKHVEVDWRNKLRVNIAWSWSLLHMTWSVFKMTQVYWCLQNYVTWLGTGIQTMHGVWNILVSV